MPNYRLAIVGCGRRSTEHAEAAALVENAEVVACCEPDAERRDAFADQFDVPLRVANAAELRQAGPLDLVHVITPPSVRWAAIEPLIDLHPRGILIEKPLATMPGEADRMYEACARAGIGLFVNHQVPFQHGWKQIRAHVLAGAVGEITSVRASSKGSLFEQGTHLFDLVRFLLDDVAALAKPHEGRTAPWMLAQATGLAGHSDNHPGPTHAAGVLAVADGWHIAFECGAPAPSWPGNIAFWLNLGIEISGTHGVLGGSLNRGWWLRTAQEEKGEPRDYHTDDRPAQADFVKAILSSLNDPDSHPSGPANARVSFNCILAAQRSALLGRPVDPRVPASDDEITALRSRLAQAA